MKRKKVIFRKICRYLAIGMWSLLLMMASIEWIPQLEGIISSVIFFNFSIIIIYLIALIWLPIIGWNSKISRMISKNGFPVWEQGPH